MSNLVIQAASNLRFTRKSGSYWRLFAAAGIVLIVAGCGSSTPGPEEVEANVQSNLGSCPLWTVGNFKKADGAAEGNLYRLDFTAEITWKGPPDKISANYARSEYRVCDPYTPYMNDRQGKVVSEKFVVGGYAIFAKTEKGWRLTRNWTPTSIQPA